MSFRIVLHNLKAHKLFISNWFLIWYWSEGCSRSRNYSNNTINEIVCVLLLTELGETPYVMYKCASQIRSLFAWYHIQNKFKINKFGFSDYIIKVWMAFATTFQLAFKIWKWITPDPVYLRSTGIELSVWNAKCNSC